MRQLVANLGQTGQRCGIDERGDGFTVLQTVFEGIRTEQDRKRHRHDAHLVASDVRDCRFRALRQDDAERSPRFTPRPASAFERRFACCCRSQKVYAAVDPASSSQYRAKRERSGECRPQQAVPMLNRAGTSI